MTTSNVKTKPVKAYKGIAMEGPIAAWYARNTFRDLKRHKLMAQRMSKKIAPGSRVLEIAPGPGYFCIELARLGDYEITGLDISKSFVEMARKNAAAANVKVDFRQGNASDMPFATEAFDFTFCQAAFKNFTEPVKAIAEMYRVLRPHGASVISDLRRDASLRDIDREIEGMGIGPVNAFLTRWTFQHVLLKNAYSAAEMGAFVAQTPFRQSRIEVDGGIGFEVWLEK